MIAICKPLIFRRGRKLGLRRGFPKRRGPESTDRSWYSRGPRLLGCSRGPRRRRDPRVSGWGPRVAAGGSHGDEAQSAEGCPGWATGPEVSGAPRSGEGPGERRGPGGARTSHEGHRPVHEEVESLRQVGDGVGQRGLWRRRRRAARGFGVHVLVPVVWHGGTAGFFADALRWPPTVPRPSSSAT